MEEKKRADREAKERGLAKFDQVWCVVDQDHHGDRLVEARRVAENRRVRLVVSVPCIEFWFLLHKVYTTKAYGNCAEVTRDLLSKLDAEYSKSSVPTDELLTGIDYALENAKKVRAHNEESRTVTPATNMDELVKALKALVRA